MAMPRKHNVTRHGDILTDIVRYLEATDNVADDFLAHLSWRLEWAIVIAHRPSVRRPSGINFHIFDFSSETAERNSTKLDRKQDLNALYQVCVFRADRKNKMAALASDWLRHFRLLLWNRWTEFNETWQEARSQRPLPSLWFSGWSEKQDGRPGLWLVKTILTSPLKPLNRIQQNLIGGKISKPSTKFVFFRPIGKTRWPPLASDWLRHFRLLCRNRWTQFKESWQEARSQPPLPSLCFSDRSEKQDGRLASDWMRYFGLLLWNCWMEFNKTWQESRSKRPQPSLCFSGRSEKQDGRPGLWLAETFSTSSLKPLNRIQRNLTGSKISTPSTKFVFFGPIWKTRWPPWPLIGWDIFDFSSETAERNSTKLDRKHDLNALYQVCVFQAIGKTRSSPWPPICWDIFDFSSETAKRNSTKLDRKEDIKALYQVCDFRADRKSKMAVLASDWSRQFWLLLWNPWTEFNKIW